MWLGLSQVPLYRHRILSTCWLGECEHDYCSAISLHHGVPGPDLAILADDSSIAARSLFVAPQDATRENGPLLQCQRFEDLFTMLWLPRDHRGVYPRYGMHLNIRLVSNPTTPDHNHLCLPCSMPYAFPPQLPLHPPPPPPSCPSTPHRFCTTRPKSPSGLTRPQTTSPVNRGYTIRPCEIPPIDTWKPASEFHDAAKVNGLDFAATIRSSNSPVTKTLRAWILFRFRFGSFCTGAYTTDGCTTHCTRQGNLCHPVRQHTVFVAELVSQLRSRNIDLDRLAAY